MSELLTIQDYLNNYMPRFLELAYDPDQVLAELRQEADELARKVGLGVHPDGRYTAGLWGIIMAR